MVGRTDPRTNNKQEERPYPEQDRKYGACGFFPLMFELKKKNKGGRHSLGKIKTCLGCFSLPQYDFSKKIIMLLFSFLFGSVQPFYSIFYSFFFYIIFFIFIEFMLNLLFYSLWEKN